MSRWVPHLLGIVALSLCSSQVHAGIFHETNRDFGSVPRGTLLTHQFKLTNDRQQPLHVASLRTSCGCAIATVGQDELAPGQATVLQVTVDTRKYGGYRQFTVHVLFDRPALEEVRITVSATSREDISLTPGQLEFGRVRRGVEAKASVQIQYHGVGEWKITGVENENGYLKPELTQGTNGIGQPTYQLTVTLRPDIPAGAWHSDLWLKTTDATVPRIRVPMMVEVESALSATPSDVQLGQVKAGGQAERKVVIRGSAPFKITKVDGADALFKVEGVDGEAKSVHVLRVTVKPDANRDELARKFRVHTNLLNGEVLEFAAHAVVVP
jgi:hypothetical protein